MATKKTKGPGSGGPRLGAGRDSLYSSGRILDKKFGLSPEQVAWLDRHIEVRGYPSRSAWLRGVIDTMRGVPVDV